MLKLVLNTFLAKIISAVCNLLVAVFISKFLGAEGKGEASILLTNITVVLLFTNVFGGATLAYLISKYDNKKIISIALTSSFIISSISCFIFYWISHNFWLSFDCALLSWLAAVLSVFQNFLIGHNKVNYLSFSTLLQSISLLAVVMVGFFVYHSNIEIYTLGLFLSYIVSLSVTIYFYRISVVQKVDKKETISFISLIKLGIQNQLSHVFYLFLMRISYYFLLLQSGKFAVGVFSNAIIIAEGIWLIASSMATVQYASILNVEKEKAIALTQFFCRASFAISLLAILVVFLIPNQLFIMVLGNDFYEVKSIVMYLSPGIILYNFSVIIGHFFSGIGKFKVNTFSNFVGVILACLVLAIYFSSFSIQQAIVFHLTAYVSISLALIIAFMRNSQTQLVHLFYNSKDLLYLKGLLKKQS